MAAKRIVTPPVENCHLGRPLPGREALMLFDKPDWHEAAACRERADLFFPPIPGAGAPDADEDYYYGWQGERRLEWEQKMVCHTCPVIDDCLLSAWKQDPDWPYEVVGVMGGTNQWERRFFRKATEAEIALLYKIRHAIGRDAAQQWRRQMEDGTPSIESLHGMNVTAAAATHAVPRQIAVNWFRRLGLPLGSPRGTPWSAKIREILADGEWHRRSDVVAEAAKSVPRGVAENKARKRGTSVEQGATWMIHDALVTLTGSRRGCERRVEQVKRSDGTRWLKWIGEFDEAAPPHRRAESTTRVTVRGNLERASA